MRITRLYHQDELSCGSNTQLCPDTSKHLIRVLRTKPGTPLVLFNGDGNNYHCTTLNDSQKHTDVSVDAVEVNNSESPITTCLIQGLSKLDRMETSIQKSVELGINQIIPVMFQRSNLKLNAEKQIKKHEHWLRVAISACEQSGRSSIPKISPIITLSHLQSELPNNYLGFTLDPKAKACLSDLNFDKQTFCFVIGPEGGLTDAELSELDALNFQRVQFGNRILRTETAGPAVLSALQVLWGDC